MVMSLRSTAACTATAAAGIGAAASARVRPATSDQGTDNRHQMTDDRQKTRRRAWLFRVVCCLVVCCLLSVICDLSSLPTLAHAEEAQEGFGVGAVGADDDGVDIDAAQHTLALAAGVGGARFELAPDAAVA